jgi:phosphoenolpyruvate carboxylase
MEVMALFVMGGWKRSEINIDIIPLFETIDDLTRASQVMKMLYEDKVYITHIRKRGSVQTIMLGFSDGTKDGGYLMANWSIYKAKVELTSISREYSSLGQKISNKEIQLTIQGQTVSSNFGTIDAAQFNIEQLLHAGISNDLFSEKNITLSAEQEDIINELAKESLDVYTELKNHPYFIEYLSHVSPLRFYTETNIGSRPAKRGSGGRLMLKDLRAIPFVGSWSQLKQNLTGYYGVGSAFRKMEQDGRWREVELLYRESPFFKTLIDNCEMAMKKCFFPLTAYISDHPLYGEIWNKIHDEFELTMSYVFKLTGKNELMADYPVEQLSIQMRERIVLPLTTIQQYAISKVRMMEEQLVQGPSKSAYEKLAMRCSFGIINAGRNSA